MRSSLFVTGGTSVSTHRSFSRPERNSHIHQTVSVSGESHSRLHHTSSIHHQRSSYRAPRRDGIHQFQSRARGPSTPSREVLVRPGYQSHFHYTASTRKEGSPDPDRASSARNQRKDSRPLSESAHHLYERANEWYEEQREYNRQEHHGWTTGYGWAKVALFGLAGFGAQYWWKTREEKLKRLDELCTIIREEAKSIYTDSCCFAPWVRDSIFKAALYDNKETTLFEKEQLDHELRSRLLVNERLQWEIRQLINNAVFGDKKIVKGVVAGQAESAIRDLKTQQYNLQIARLSNHALLNYQLRRFDVAFDSVNKLMATILEYDTFLVGANGLKYDAVLTNKYGENNAKVGHKEFLFSMMSNAYNIRGLLHRRDDKNKKADHDFSLALVYQPTNARAMSNRGWLRAQDMKCFKDAMTDQTEANSMYPNQYPIVMGIGYIAHQIWLLGINKQSDEKFDCRNTEWLENANNRYQRALDITKDKNPIALLNYGTLLANQGKIEEAVALIESAKETRRHHEDTSYYLGYLYAYQGDVEKAVLEFKQAQADLSDHRAAVEFISGLLERIKGGDSSGFNPRVESQSQYNTNILAKNIKRAEVLQYDAMHPAPFNSIVLMPAKEDVYSPDKLDNGVNAFKLTTEATLYDGLSTEEGRFLNKKLKDDLSPQHVDFIEEFERSMHLTP